jgi:hypothetical protein
MPWCQGFEGASIWGRLPRVGASHLINLDIHKPRSSVCAHDQHFVIPHEMDLSFWATSFSHIFTPESSTNVMGGPAGQRPDAGVGFECKSPTGRRVGSRRDFTVGIIEGHRSPMSLKYAEPFWSFVMATSSLEITFDLKLEETACLLKLRTTLCWSCELWEAARPWKKHVNLQENDILTNQNKVCSDSEYGGFHCHDSCFVFSWSQRALGSATSGHE